MDCPTCHQPMTPMFTSLVCDHCDPAPHSPDIITLPSVSLVRNYSVRTLSGGPTTRVSLMSDDQFASAQEPYDLGDVVWVCLPNGTKSDDFVVFRCSYAAHTWQVLQTSETMSRCRLIGVEND